MEDVAKMTTEEGLAIKQSLSIVLQSLEAEEGILEVVTKAQDTVHTAQGQTLIRLLLVDLALCNNNAIAALKLVFARLPDAYPF